MPTQQEILDAMLFDLTLLSGPLNTTADPAFVLTYQFAGTTQPADLWTPYTGWTPPSTAEQDAVRAALDHIQTFLNVSFVEVTGQADPDINIGKVSIPNGYAGYGGYKYWAYSTGELSEYDGFAVFDSALDLSTPDSVNLILHELGHALTLKHPFDGGAPLPVDQENNKYTIMSYDPVPETGAYPDAMMLYDIFALQAQWGTNATYNDGDTLYTAPRFATIDPLWDTGGNDTLDAGAYGGGVALNLAEGAFSRLGSFDDIVIPFNVQIENAFGGDGNDTILGNALDNLLLGGAGNDRIEANTGNDTVIGGNDTDLAFLGAGNDRFEDNSQSGANGADTVYGNAGSDTILGGGGDDDFRGQNGNDSLTGGSGNDLLNGGAGNDTIRGGTGDDTVTGGNGRDLIYMGSGDDLFIDNTQGGFNGRDEVYANAGNDTVGGGAGDDVFNGQDGNDRLLGRLGNDRLYGGNQSDTMEGGAGNDTIAGGNGRDWAYMGDGNDIWWDNDQVQYGHDYVAGGNGDDLFHVGAGNDTMSGGAGADTFEFAALINDDIITDYELGVDALHFDTGLFGGPLTQVYLDSIADTGTGTLVLDFNDTGNTLTFEGISSTAGLLNDITLI